MHNPIRTLIVDDELPGRLNLRYALEEYPDWQVCGEAHSVAQARQLMQQQSFDVLFLDVQMPQESGLALARDLYQQSGEPETVAVQQNIAVTASTTAPADLTTSLPLIVFVTAYNVYAVQAFEVHALDYLLKPFDDERFAQTIKRVQQQLSARSAHRQAMQAWAQAQTPAQAQTQAQTQAQQYCQVLSVHSQGMIERVALADVEWIAAAGNYLELHLAKRTVLHRMALSQLAHKLDPKVFVRIHRCSIVQVAQCRVLRVVGDGKYMLELACGMQLNVSERYLDEVKAILLCA